MATDMTVANEIRRQIGAAAFFMMGTRQWLGDTNSLMFPIKGCKQYNKIRVTLTPADLYDVEFIKVGRAPQFTSTTHRVDGIYVDQLHEVISRHTGLALSIPRIRGINA